eukprot:3736670-Rhodomonas_salina.2
MLLTTNVNFSFKLPQTLLLLFYFAQTCVDAACGEREPDDERQKRDTRGEMAGEERCEINYVDA